MSVLCSSGCVQYLTESELLNPSSKDALVRSEEGTKFLVNRLLLASCCPYIAQILRTLDEAVLQEPLVIFTNFPTSVLEQIILLASRGVMTSHTDVTAMLEDQGIVSAFATLGIDLSKFKFEKSPVQGQIEITPDVYSLVTIKQELQFFEPVVAEDDYTKQQQHQQQQQQQQQYNQLQDDYYQDYDYLEDLPLTQTGRKNKNKNGGKSKQKRKRKSDYDDDDEDFDFDASIKEEYDSSNVKSKQKSKKKPKSDESDTEDDELDDSDPEFTPKKTKRRSKTRSVKNDDASFEEDKKPKIANFKTEGERDWNKKYQCPDCIKGYNARRDLNNHRARHLSGGIGWKCLQCEDKTFGRRDELLKHVDEVHKHATYICPYCPKTFTGQRFGQYTRHQEVHLKHAKAEINFCVACGYSNENAKAMEYHVKLMGPFHNDLCVTCGVKVSSWQDHQNHVKEVHAGVRQYKCGKCDQNYVNTAQLRSHRIDAHSSEKIYSVCAECGQTVANITMHMRKYHGTDQVPCPHCPKILGHITVLKAHIAKSHLNLQCHECGKVMPNKAKYKVHMDTKHTPAHLRPYQCTICPNKGFATLDKYREHNNIHTNERPHKCPHCNVGFNSRPNMFSHAKTCKSKVAVEASESSE